MAIYHLSVKAISRSAGRCATAAAAYRAGEKIIDQRNGTTHDYSRRSGVLLAEVVLPNNAPAWACDRAALWNAAELAEKRKDSCVAREVEVALPAELNADQRLALAREFAKEMANHEGCAVDIALHKPSKGGDQRNWHAHMLRTTRIIEASGLGEKLDTEKSGRNRKADLEVLRARWEGLANAYLARARQPSRIDRRSLAAQGTNRKPTKHLGPQATALEHRTGQPSRLRSMWQKTGQQEVRQLRQPIAQDVAALTQARQAVSTLADRLSTLTVQCSRFASRLGQAKQDLATARHVIAHWREQHPLRAWLHDHGQQWVARSLGEQESRALALYQSFIAIREDGKSALTAYKQVSQAHSGAVARLREVECRSMVFGTENHPVKRANSPIEDRGRELFR